MTQKPYKRMIAFMLAVVVTVTMIAFFPTKVNAVPSGVPWDVFIDEDNNICIITQDKIKSSSIWYQTVGFSVSRCRYPAQKMLNDSKDFAWFAIDKQYIITQRVGNIEINMFKLPLSTVQEKIAGISAEWGNEVKDALEGGPPCYLRFDSTMIIYDNGVPNGTVLPDGTPFPTTYTNEAPKDGTNPDEIKNARAWADPSGLDSHYNRYLLIGGGAVSTEKIGGDIYLGKDSNEPIYEIANDSDKFDLSQGIPSSEDIKSSYRAASWYGNTDVYVRMSTKKYRVKYTYKWTETKTVSGQTTSQEKSKTHEYEIDAKVAYQYLANANFYDFTSLTAQNLAYPCSITYDSEVEVPMKAITTKKYFDVTDENNGKKKDAQGKEISWKADDAKHIKWAGRPADATISVTSEADADARINNGTDLITLQTAISNGTKTKNDLLQIDGVTYLSNQEFTGCNFNVNNWRKCINSSAVKAPYGNRIGGMQALKKANRKMEDDTMTVTIPAETENGKYPSGINCFYTQKIKNNGYGQTFTAGIFGGEDIMKHIISGYAKNEPVNVHTPVIAPVTIYQDDEPVDEPTQLAKDKLNTDVSTQLILDNSYEIKWDADMHREIMGYAYSGDPSKYDKYVTKKEVRFPFKVEYNGKFYNKGTWITLKAPDYWDDPAKEGDYYKNHWRLTPFYIPSYAEECGEKGNEAKIEYKVHAINVEGRYEDSHEGETEIVHNITYSDDGANYVATYEIPVQLSGVIYDFTVTGLSDKKQFYGTKLFEHNASTDVHIPFCRYKWDKKVGTKNRLGEDDVRYRIDGTLNNKWETVNTLPIMLGKSNHWKDMGNLVKGTSFAFSFKTIANLYHDKKEDADEGKGDYVRIRPSFRYVRPDGTVLGQKDIKIYYTDADGDVFVEYGNEKETENLRDVYLGHPEFDYSKYLFNDLAGIEGKSDYQYGAWLDYTVNHYNIFNPAEEKDKMKNQPFLKRKIPSYNLSDIILNSDLRFLSGEYEQLKMNSDKEHAALKTYKDLDPDFSEIELFRDSMQTWYGRYTIPTELYVVDKTKKGYDFDLKKCEKIRPDDETIFEQDGYLIVNFEIETFMNGKPHLVYFGNSNNKNMWKTEGFTYKGTIDKDLPEIEFLDGDVAVIDLSQSMNDRYKPSLFNIN